MQELLGNEMVSYNTGALAINQTGDYYTGQNFYDACIHYSPYWWPTYHCCEKSKIEQAFKIIGKLMESKIIEKELTVKEFMKLVNDIAEVI